MTLAIIPFDDEHLPAAAELLATREHARAAASPPTPFCLDDVDEARAAIAALRTSPDATAVVALDGGRLNGYMIGAARLPDPLGGESMFTRPRSASIDENGYAAAPDVAFDAYRAMYAALAAGWTARGYLAHYAGALSSQGEAVRAWRSLGFGRAMVRGLRDLSPVDLVPGSARAEVHRAGDEDLDVLFRLMVANLRFHSGPPVFQPYLPETETHERDEERRQLANPANARFIAYREGEPVAIQTYFAAIDRPGRRLRTVHLQHGFTHRAERGAGLAASMLDQTLAWAREQGFEGCTVNWLSANLLGARFWQSHGFRPFSERLCRVVDERLTWARQGNK